MLAYFGCKFYSTSRSDYNLEKGTMFDDIFKEKNLHEYKCLLLKQGIWIMGRMENFSEKLHNRFNQTLHKVHRAPPNPLIFSIKLRSILQDMGTVVL